MKLLTKSNEEFLTNTEILLDMTNWISRKTWLEIMQEENYVKQFFPDASVTVDTHFYTLIVDNQNKQFAEELLQQYNISHISSQDVNNNQQQLHILLPEDSSPDSWKFIKLMYEKSVIDRSKKEISNILSNNWNI